MLKVLHVINNLAAGGAEKLVLDLVRSQRTAGAAADLLVLNERGAVYSADDLPADASLRVSAPRSGVYNPMHISRLVGPLRDSDVVHVHLFPSQYWTAIAHLFGNSKASLVTTEHTTFHRRMGYPLLRPLERLVYTRFDKIVAISDETRAALMNWLRLPAERFALIGNGIDLRRFRDAQPHATRRDIGAGLSAEDRLLVMVGRFEHPKDQATVLRALAKLDFRYKLVLVGDGENRAELERTSRELGVAERVVLTGFRRDVPEILKSCDAAILSSHWEGVPLAALESMAAGVPVIASNVVGLASLVGGAGRLFSCADPASLAAVVTATLDMSQSDRDVMLEKQHERVSAYDLAGATRAHLELYHSLSNGSDGQ